MREIFEVFFLMSLQAASLVLTAIGSVFNASASVLHIYFLRRAARHDEKFAPKGPRTPTVVYSSDDSEAN